MERTIKFQYFKPFQEIKEKGKWKKSGPFDFLAWIDYIDKAEVLTIAIELKDTKARLEEMKLYDEKFWILRFMKLRDENIPSIAKDNKKAEDISLEDDEYIGEDLYMLYDSSCGIAMIQSNRFSLGITRLSEFFTNTPNVENKKIVFNAISDNIDIKTYRKRCYKSIELSFANLVHDVPNSKSSLSQIMNSYRKFNGMSGNVKITLGRSKEESLNVHEMNELFNEIGDYENVVGAKLKVKDDDKAYVEIIDLFDNVCHDFISFKLEKRTSLGFEYAAQNMLHNYKERKGSLISLVVKDV